MIRLAHILPTAYLPAMQKRLLPFHLVLAHRLLEDTAYRDFYVQRRQAGDYIVLDNSAFEFGEAVTDDLIHKAVSLLQPQEVVLPDILGEATRTYQRVTEFLEKHRVMRRRGVRFMAVPHGRTFREYLACYQLISRLAAVHSIGVGAMYCKRFAAGGQTGRQRIFATLAKNQLLADKAHHLLGLGDSGHLELQGLKSYSHIRSCDSSAAYVQAAHGIFLEPREPYEKIAAKIDLGAALENRLRPALVHNMQVLQGAAR